MKPEYFYQKNEFVFAQTIGHKPYPARVVKVNAGLGIYTVAFIGYKSTSDILAGAMEKFDDQTINKYVRLYQKSNDRVEKTILKKIEIAKKKYDRYIMKNYKKIGKAIGQNIQISQKIDHHQPKQQRLETEMVEKRTTPDQFQQQAKTGWSGEHKTTYNNDNESCYFNIIGNQQKSTIQQHYDQQEKLKKEIEQNLSKLSPIHSNTDSPFEIQSEAPSSSSPELLSVQTISSAASLYFSAQPHRPKKEAKPKQPIQIIKEQNEISRNTSKYANHPIYDRHQHQLPSITSSTEGLIETKAINECEEVSIYDIDCQIDELELQDNDYWGLLEYMAYRKKKLSILSESETITHLIKIIDILMHELERARDNRQARMLTMKKKQYLIVILSKNIPFKYFLIGNCLSKMIDFTSLLQNSPLLVKSIFVIENFNIRSRLNILYQKFIRIDPTQLSLSQEAYDKITKQFEKYREMKFVY